jgi:hypothetical protein
VRLHGFLVDELDLTDANRESEDRADGVLPAMSGPEGPRSDSDADYIARAKRNAPVMRIWRHHRGGDEAIVRLHHGYSSMALGA